MADFKIFDEFLKNIGNGTIDLDTHTFKAMLSNVAPVQDTDDTKSDLVEIAAGNGYVAGGVTLAGVTYVETGAGTAIWRWNANDFSWIAAGGNIAQFRYIIIYDDTAASDELVGFWDYGSAVDLVSGNTFLVDIQANGIFEVTRT